MKKPDHHLRLNEGAWSDLAWWNESLVDWNGVSLLSALGEQEPSIALMSDASGSWGCGEYWGTQWFQLPWSITDCSVNVNITTKELIPIVIAATIWGRAWTGLVVCSHCDNEVVVAVLNRHISKDADLMHLLRCLTFFEAKFSIRMVATHVAGVHNTLVDDLSRDRLSSFLQAAENMSLTGQCFPPQPLLDMIMNHKPDWISLDWRGMFKRTLSLV